MPIADRCWGYNQVGVLVDSILSPNLFSSIPLICQAEREFGFKVDFVSSVEGKLVRIDHLNAIKQLSSFMSIDLLPSIGSTMRVTIDCFTGCGSVSLTHKDKKQLMADVETIREYEKTMWIVEAL